MARGETVAMIAVLAAEGSAPREAGTRMFVTTDRTIGTIGGGNLEFQAIRQARAILDRAPGDWRVQDYPLGPLLGQCCGGRVRLLVEHLDAAQSGWLTALRDRTGAALESRFEPGRIDRKVLAHLERSGISARGAIPAAGDRLVEPLGETRTSLSLFGAGHVGLAVARLMDSLPVALRWSDTRLELATLPGVEILSNEAMIEGARSERSAVLIMTHDHALDYRLTAAALEGTAPFVGLIGSLTKRARFVRRLRDDGFDDAALDRLVCPIGVSGVTGKEPEVIAVAVAAQLLIRFPEVPTRGAAPC
jgi:xanthine dehydrogenase accessory factor